MTELETLERAKMYVDKLANGVNPLSDEPIKDDDVINNVRISRCLFYISSVLSKVIDNGGEVKQVKTSRNEFQIDMNKLDRIELSKNPIGIADLADRISVCKADENMKKISYSKITGWLCEKGFLTMVNRSDGKRTKRPTLSGKDIGISLEERNGLNGPYEVVVYSLSAQHFIVDNLEAILNS